jgi:hypothetical protein
MSYHLGTEKLGTCLDLGEAVMLDGPVWKSFLLCGFISRSDARPEKVVCGLSSKVLKLKGTATAYGLLETFRYIDQQGQWNGKGEQICTHGSLERRKHLSQPQRSKLTSSVFILKGAFSGKGNNSVGGSSGFLRERHVFLTG